MISNIYYNCEDKETGMNIIFIMSVRIFKIIKTIKEEIEMKLKDLKEGMVCELRNGHEIIILSNNKYVFNRPPYSIYKLSKDYNDNLVSINKDRKGINYDIMKATFGNEVIYERRENNLFFEPKKGETYYFINNHNPDLIIEFINDSAYDDDIFKTNIAFKTREEAKKELLRQEAKIRVIKEIARLNQGWDVREHWGNDDIAKYYIVSSCSNSNLHYSTVYNIKVLDNNLYLKTWELAEQLIETHSDDLKLMLEVE